MKRSRDSGKPRIKNSMRGHALRPRTRTAVPSRRMGSPPPLGGPQGGSAGAQAPGDGVDAAASPASRSTSSPPASTSSNAAPARSPPPNSPPPSARCSARTGRWRNSPPHGRREAFPDWARKHLDQEVVATSIRVSVSTTVHGLLQAEDYARALLRLSASGPSEELLEQRLTARLDRQPRLRDAGLREFWMVRDEAALLRPVGSTSIMRGQLARLLEAADEPKITIQVVPFASGGHPSMSASTMLLDHARRFGIGVQRRGGIRPSHRRTRGGR
jgi:hypothetical protein